MIVGTRAQVFHGTAERTSGGLTKADLIQGKDGLIKSRAAVNAAKQRMKAAGGKVAKQEKSNNATRNIFR